MECLRRIFNAKLIAKLVLKRQITVFLFFSSLASSAFCLDLASIETQIRRHIRDTASSSSLQRYSDTVLDAMINESQREVVNLTHCLHKRTTFTLTTGTTYYTGPTDMIVPKAVYYTNASRQTYELKEEQEQTYRKNNPDYERQSGPPSIYFVRHSTSGANPMDVAFIPVATSASTGTVNFDYYNETTDMSSDSDEPFDGYDHLIPYHETIVYLTVGKIKLIEGESDVASNYYSLYQGLINNMLSRLGQAPNYNPNLSAGGGR